MTQVDPGVLSNGALICSAESLRESLGIFMISAYGIGLRGQAFGDSITYGANATTAANQWVDLVAATTGWSMTNSGISGRELPDNAALSIYAKAVLEGDNYVLLSGYNDMRHHGLSAAGQLTYQKTLYAVLVWLGIPHANKIFGQNAAITYGGSWSNNTAYGLALGKYASTTGATATATITGTAVYIGYTSWAGAGTMSVTIDDVSYGTIDQSVGVNTNAGIGIWPSLFRVGGLSNTAHTVVLTVTSSGLNTLLDFIASNDMSAIETQPRVYAGNTLLMDSTGYTQGGAQWTNGSDAAVTAFNVINSAVVAELAADGLLITDVDVSSAYDVTTDLDTADHVHPNDTGHGVIADTFLASMIFSTGTIVVSTLSSSRVVTGAITGVGGVLKFGSRSSYDDTNDRLGVGTLTPRVKLEVHGIAGESPSIQLTDADVAHGINILGYSTDTCIQVSTLSGNGGGGLLWGTSDVDGVQGLTFWGVIGSSTPSIEPVQFSAGKKNGSTIQAIAAGEKAFVFRNSGAETYAGTALITVLGNGDTTFAGTITAAAISSHAHAASDITSGTVATARLGSGTANSGTFLRGDQTWATPAGAAPAGSGTELQYRSDSTTFAAVTNSSFAANVLTINSAAVFNETGTDVDFRIEGDTDTNLLFADASLDRVSVGVAALALAKFHVEATSIPFRVSYSSGNYMTIDVASDGMTTFDGAGGNRGFTLNKYLIVNDGTYGGLIILQSGGVTKATFAVSASTDGGVIGSVAGDGYFRTASGAWLFSTNNGGHPALYVSATAGVMRQQYSAAVYVTHTVSSGGDLTVAPTGTTITLSGGVSVGPITFSVLNALTATATLGVYRITDRGNKLAYPDGTNWRFVGDDAIIS